MIDTVIVSGGKIQKEFALGFFKEKIKKDGRNSFFLIAADKGLEFLIQNQMEPDLAVGDFDSMSEQGSAYLENRPQIEVVRLKPEKDDSDTQSAVHFAVKRGAKDILLLGATGGRMDHMMANLGLLSLGKKMGVKIAIADQNNYMVFLKSGSVLHKQRQFGKYVSFFPIGGDVLGLTLRGFKYPLNRHYLTPADSGLTVSNEIVEEQAEVTFEQGDLLMIMSRD